MTTNTAMEIVRRGVPAPAKAQVYSLDQYRRNRCQGTEEARLERREQVMNDAMSKVCFLAGALVLVVVTVQVGMHLEWW